MQEVKKKVEAIDGLETLMSSLGLEDKLPDAANWCQVNVAESVRDIHEADCAEQLAKDLGLPLVKANKLIKAIKEAAKQDANILKSQYIVDIQRKCIRILTFENIFQGGRSCVQGSSERCLDRAADRSCHNQSSWNAYVRHR
jgi:hypothetical protein